MIIQLYLAVLAIALVTGYVSIVRREAELLYAGLSLLAWLAVTFTSTSIEIVSDGQTLEVGEPGLTAIGAFGFFTTLYWLILVVADRVPTNESDVEQSDFDTTNDTTN